MTILTILKIITRSWWRNKVFFFISIVSLAIGLACTNLLFTYYVHDYNIESGNRDKNRIFCLRQDNPMQDGSKVAYADANIPPTAHLWRPEAAMAFFRIVILPVFLQSSKVPSLPSASGLNARPPPINS